MKRLLVFLFIVAFVAAGLTGWRQFIRQSMPYRYYQGSEQFVEIEPGMSTAAIGERLIGHGVVQDVWTWRIAAWRSGQATRLKAGEYRFDRPLTAAQVIDKLARGEVHLRTITFPEGLTIRQMARVYHERGF
ncbi:MAG: endolytic transglycosylase MltG, partial [Vicinamibacterales bacterium]|nr:endolytic transglycosylase MltG [Vicinamibacterales bacterium]